MTIDGDDYRERDLRDADEPAFALTEKARSWIVLSERQAPCACRSEDEPSPTLTAAMDNGNFRWIVNTGRDWKEGGSREDAQTFDANERPAAALDGKGRFDVPASLPVESHWGVERPSTTVCGDASIPAPGWRGLPDDYDAEGNYIGKRSMDDATRVTLEEAGVLQGFPGDYPWQGTRSKQFEQVGNAIPPPLALAVLAALIADTT